jgi:dTDP-4-amino-4,6-dideoxygalactose transaminase
LANCTDALTAGIIALNLPRQSLVGVSDYTFTASAHAIARAGHVAVALDVGDDYCLATAKDVTAVLAVDVFGNMTDIKQFDMPVIMDCAQSLESKNNNVWSAKQGIFSCVSFSPSKTVSSWGSGGALLTDDDAVAATVRKLRLHGKSANADAAIHPCLNSMLSTFEAACIWVGLEHSTKWQLRRQQIATYLCSESRYQSAINWQQDQHTLHKLVFQSTDMNSVKKRLQQHSIEYAQHYQQLIHTEPLYQQLAQNCSNSRRLSQISFTVPNQHTLTDYEVEQIAKALK